MVKGRSAKKSLIFVTVCFSSGQDSFIKGTVSIYFTYRKMCRELGDFSEPNDAVICVSGICHSLQVSELRAYIKSVFLIVFG